MRRYCNKQPLV